ncbi:SMC-Scp complex subunit ScpB [Bifidobacterium amazonense]|uniref:SMC-Scp complex subunit ScpB n=2 Tax=Bifidobacterium amazonense TaxID=2809027 RepID=A0ABS9VRR0_9BIFI|nr:SMC-Scp complex subunit ScpB [Bifidobacterium amazonense]MCH9274783.1 SMC-Scp complex subunit ScpB [Bifidobacterium amazonense]
MPDATATDAAPAQHTDDYEGGLRACLEAVLMAADEPQQEADLARVLGRSAAVIGETLDLMRADYDAEQRGFELRHTARGWQYASRAVFEPVVTAFVTDGQTARLSQAAMEALAIIAYQQPVTRAQVTAIRGVNSDGVIRSLTVRGLVREDGADPESRAARLVTTELFLDKMGLDSLAQLPELAPFLPPSEALADVASAER